MRNALVLLLLCLFSGRGFSQEVSFYLHIMDRDRIVSHSGGIPVFDDPEINNIFADYTVTHFAKAFPLSGYDYLQKVYQVTADSIGLAQELVAFDSLLFPIFEEIGEVVPTGVFYPNDWIGDWPNDTAALAFIKAPEAWDICKGDSNIIIGVTDTYFDLDHEDMQGQYIKVGRNVALVDDIYHGTFVASLIAARTNNGIGIPGIGFNCKIYAGQGGESELLSMVQDRSVDKVRVLNASWLRRNQTKDYLYFNDPTTTSQGIFNEIYELGVVTVSSAGNARSNIERTARTFTFPASFDHNISVSGVGYFGTNPTDSAFNAAYVHDLYAGDSTLSHQHNTRVDVCAPSVQISGHTYNPDNPSEKYEWRQAWGTSFAAPMVAGTAGLILSHRPWLTPYQVEYVLKKSSFDHYTIPYNQKYAGPTRWTGRIGAGTLDAGAALQMVDVDDFFHDHPDATTFRIKGVKLTNRCVPGTHAGVPDPQIEVVMENGKPPYTYRWESLPDNEAHVFPRLDSIGVSQITGSIPGILTLNPNPVFHYRLTVYDNSDIQKVANKVVRIELTAADVWDLAMQDAYADMYDEPNQMEVRSYLDWNIWESPDLWNRITQDGGLVHQDPDTMTTNYMYVRVRNVGCVASPSSPDSASMHLYWTLAKTGEIWDRDWIGNSTLPGTSLPAGGAVTPPAGIPIPSIKPGGELILTHPWLPPKPQDFDTSGMLQRIDVCGLARIETMEAGMGMAFPEIDTTKVNVVNNNNIVTRNFVSINLSAPKRTTGVVVGNPSDASGEGGPYTLEIITENQLQPYIHGHLATYMDMELHLGGLYDVWAAGGKQGNPTSSDDGLKTVSWDMEQPLRLENIMLMEDEEHYVILEFNRKEDIDPIYPVENQQVHFRLTSPKTVDIDNGDGTSFPVVRDYVHSAVNYAITVPEEVSGEKPGPSGLEGQTGKAGSWFEVYPNPVDGELTVQVSGGADAWYRILVVDMAGRTVFEDGKAVFRNGSYRINTSGYTPGVYSIQLVDSKGKSSVRKFVKAD